jgi:hypothetical protein
VLVLLALLFRQQLLLVQQLVCVLLHQMAILLPPLVATLEVVVYCDLL